METTQLSPLAQSYINKSSTPVQNQTEQASVEPVKDGNKKIKTALAALGAIGAAAIGITIAVKHHNKINTNKVVDEVADNIQRAADNAVDNVQRAVEDVADNVQRAADDAIEDIQKNVDKVAQDVQQAAESLKDKAADAVKDIQPVNKTFYNSSNNLVENINLEKGRALSPDGTGFSGVMLTKNNKGQEIAVEYKDGFIQKSTIDGKLRKEYLNTTRYNNQNISEKISRNEGNEIISYSCKGEVTGKSRTFFEKDGKVKRFVETDPKNTKYAVAHDFKDGKLLAKSNFYDGRLTGGEIYNSQGSIVKELYSFYDDQVRCTRFINGKQVEADYSFDVPDVMEVSVEELLKNKSKEVAFKKGDERKFFLPSGNGGFNGLNSKGQGFSVHINFYDDAADSSTKFAAIQYGDKNVHVTPDGISSYDKNSPEDLREIYDKISEFLPVLKEANFNADFDKIEEYLAKLIQ